MCPEKPQVDDEQSRHNHPLHSDDVEVDVFDDIELKPRHNSHKDLILSGGEASSIATASAPTTVGGALLEPIYADLNKTRQDIAIACFLFIGYFFK